MKWRALAVAVAGMSVALWACNFQKEWDKYCSFPGRCAQFADAGQDASIQVAQGAVDQKIRLAGQFLADASISLDPDNAGGISVQSVDDGGINLAVTVHHGVDAGERLAVRLHWEWEGGETNLVSIPLLVTAITAAVNGNDDGGSGTTDNPYRSLLRASQHSDRGDVISLGVGPFDSLCAGLKPGVAVEGLPDGGSVVMGNNAPGTCGLTLTDPTQALRFVTISSFPVGLSTTADGGSPTALGVTVQDCDVGVYVPPGGKLLLQEAALRQNGNGLVVDGGDVVVQGGLVTGSARNGVLMTGSGGTLSLTGAGVNGNASSSGDDLTGAGVLIASSGGTATIGSLVAANGHTGVTVAGVSNRVTFDGADLRGSTNGSIALVVKDNSAMVFMRNTTFQLCPTGLKVEGFASFNGGTGDGGYGTNNFTCGDMNTEILDARGTDGQDMDFGDTTIRGLHMDAGVNITGSPTALPGLGITVVNSSNPVHFH